jgi:hypothetical protein
MDEKQNEPMKAVEMKRHIQEHIYEETKDMSDEEFIAYMHRRIAESRFASFLSFPGTPNVVKPAEVSDGA